MEFLNLKQPHGANKYPQYTAVYSEYTAVYSRVYGRGLRYWSLEYTAVYPKSPKWGSFKHNIDHHNWQTRGIPQPTYACIVHYTFVPTCTCHIPLSPKTPFFTRILPGIPGMPGYAHHIESLEEEQNAYLAEFAEIQRARQTWGQNTGTRVEMNCFDVLEPPSLWFREHTAVVCLWRSIQHNAFMHSYWMSWVSSKRKWSWTDVKDEDVLHFLSSLPTVALHTCAQRHYALGMSIEAWETTHRTFGVSQIWNGDVWSGIHQVGGLEAGEVHPWIPAPEVPDLFSTPASQAACILPSVQLHTTHTTLEHGTADAALHRLLQGRTVTSDVLIFTQDDTAAHELATLLCFTDSIKKVASNVKIHTAFQFVPRTLIGSAYGSWWFVSASYQPFLPHALNMMWGPLLRKYGAHIHTPGWTDRQHVYDTIPSQKRFFDEAWATECQVRGEDLRAKWNAKLRRVNTQFKWEHIPESLNRVNQALEFATEATPRKIAALRRTKAPITRPGT